MLIQNETAIGNGQKHYCMMIYKYVIYIYQSFCVLMNVYNKQSLYVYTYNKTMMFTILFGYNTQRTLV